MSRSTQPAIMPPPNTRSVVPRPPHRVASIGIAVVLHGAIVGVMLVLPKSVPAATARTMNVAEAFDVDLKPVPREPVNVAEPREPAPREPPPRAPPPAEPSRVVAPRIAAPRPIAPAATPPAETPLEAPPAPAPEAAAAAALVAAEAPAAESSNTFVVGQAARYAGGVSAAEGTAPTAVHDSRARADGVPGGTGDGSGDRSRPATLLGGRAWDCPLPSEAEDEGIAHATVQLQLHLSVDGRIEDVKVMSDPGYGFAREALRCARGKRFVPALDTRGVAIATTQLVNVRF